MRRDILTFRVAVVIASFNRASTLLEAVCSCLNLKLSPEMLLNIIVVDDGSTDESFEKLLATPFFEFEPKKARASLNSSAEQFPAVQRVATSRKGVDLLQIANSERGAARNVGAQWSRTHYQSEWFLFLDSDDVLTEFALFRFFNDYKRVIADSEQSRARRPALFYSWYVNWNGHDSPILAFHSFPKLPSGDLSTDVLSETRIALGASLICAEDFFAVGGFPEARALSGSEDKILLTRLAFRADAIFCPQVSTWYRQHVSNTNSQKMLTSIHLMENELELSIRAQFPSSSSQSLRVFRQHCFLKTLGISIFSKQLKSSAKLILFKLFRMPQLLFDFKYWRLLVSFLKLLIVTKFNRSLFFEKFWSK